MNGMNLGDDDNWLGASGYSEEIAARKHVTGQEYWKGSKVYWRYIFFRS